MKIISLRFFVPPVLTIFTLGCASVGPDYVEPAVPVQTQWMEKDDPLISTLAPSDADWWSAAFNDPVLDELVTAALAQNLSLRAAGLRVLQAQQVLMITAGSRYPQQQQLSGRASTFDQGGMTGESYSIGFNLSWEADIWGKFSRQIASASADLDASAASYDGIMLSLVGQVAENYLLIRATQKQLEVANYNLSLQQESLQITSAKFNAGATSELDVVQAKSLLYNTEASLAGLETDLQQLKNSVAVLLGKPPQEMNDLLIEVKPIPTVTPQIALGMPQDIIRQRPDLRAAERQLAAQSEQIGVAAAALYPSFGLGGSIGTSVNTADGQEFSDLFSSGTGTSNFFGFFQWNIFNYGRLKNNVLLQDAVFQELLTNYHSAVLQAQAEVENAIVAYLNTQQQLQALQSAADAAERAAFISSTQYRNGMVDFNTVITTLASLAAQQTQLAAVQGEIATNLVDVYLSIGGAWHSSQGVNPADFVSAESRAEMMQRTGSWEKVFKQASDGGSE